MPIEISLVKRYVRQDIKYVRTVADVASHFRISEETLRKSFRRTGGQPLSEYILGVRLALVKRLLASTELYCFEIVYRAGFRREDSAARTFRSKTGQTMEEYRRRSRRRRR